MSTIVRPDVRPAERRIDGALNAPFEGDACVKSPVDVACRNILRQVAGPPACELLGGRRGPRPHVLGEPFLVVE